jgi:recyclin-1
MGHFDRTKILKLPECMDKFATLEPVRLYGLKSVGALPTDLHLLILSHLPIPDFPAYSLCSHSTAALAQDDSLWEKRWNALQVDKHNLASVVDCLDDTAHATAAAALANAPPTLAVDDDFGDFASASPVNNAGFFSALKAVTPSARRNSFRSKYIRVHGLLKPSTRALSSPPHVILSALSHALSRSASLSQQAKIFHILALFLSPRVQPFRTWQAMYTALRAAMDGFDATLLAAFDLADGKDEEQGMKEAAEASWEVWDGTGDWEMGKVWAEKREVFYEQDKWNPLDNFMCVKLSSALACADVARHSEGGVLDFDPMDQFMNTVLAALVEHGSRAVRVFPPESQVLINFADRLAVEVVRFRPSSSPFCF